MCSYKIQKSCLFFLLICYKIEFVDSSGRPLKSTTNPITDNTINNEKQLENETSSNRDDRISEFNDYKLLSDILTNSRQVPVKTHNNNNPITKHKSSDNLAKPSTSSSQVITSSSISKSKSQVSKPKATNVNLSEDSIKSFLNSGIKVITLDPLDNNKPNSSSKSPSTSVNNTSDFEVTKYAHVLECSFKPTTKCVEVKYDNSTVWKYGDQNFNSYPKLLRFDLVSIPMITLEFQHNSVLSFVYRHDKWKVKFKKLNIKDSTSSEVKKTTASKDLSINAPQEKTIPESPLIPRKPRTYTYNQLDQEEEEEADSTPSVPEESGSGIGSETVTSSEPNFSGNSINCEPGEKEPVPSTSKNVNLPTSNNESTGNNLTRVKSLIHTPRKSEKLEELQSLKEIEKLREVRHMEELERRREREGEISGDQTNVQATRTMNISVPEKKEMLKKFGFSFENVIPSESVKIFTSKNNKATPKENDTSQYELLRLGDDFLRYKFKDDANCVKVEYNNKELYNVNKNNKELNYQLNIEEFDICGRTKTAFMIYNNDILDVLKYKDGKWNKIVSGNVKHVTLDINKKETTNEYEYNKDSLKNIGTYTAKDGYVINSIVKKKGTLNLIGKDKIIWHAYDHTEFAYKVVIDGVVSGSDTRFVYVKLLTDDVLEYVKYKEQWKEKQLPSSIDLDLDDNSNLYYFDCSEKNGKIDFVPKNGIMIRTVSEIKEIWRAKNPTQYATKVTFVNDEKTGEKRIIIYQGDGLEVTLIQGKDKQTWRILDNKEEINKSEGVLGDQGRKEHKKTSERRSRKDRDYERRQRDVREYARYSNNNNKDKVEIEKTLESEEPSQPVEETESMNEVMDTVLTRNKIASDDVKIITSCGPEFEGEKYKIRMGFEGTTYNFNDDCHCLELDYLDRKLWTHKGKDPYPTSINLWNHDKTVVIRFKKKFIVYRISGGKWRGQEHIYPDGENYVK